jgi:ribosomal protein S18 acetylase RimI-like enzyme
MQSTRKAGEAMDVRHATAEEVDRLATIWHDGWHEAHAHLAPPGLAEFRTLDSFRDRIEAALSNTRVTGPPQAATGFCIVKDDELYQLYVSVPARGSGAAAALIADAEARIAVRADTAWLACAIGNDRAARFYEKCGWRRTGTVDYEADTSKGHFTLSVWRYEKSLRRPIEYSS